MNHFEVAPGLTGPLGFYVHGDDETRCYVAKHEVPELIAWLRKTYPQHFNDAKPQSSSLGTFSANIELVGVEQMKADTAQIAEALERAASAMQRIQSSVPLKPLRRGRGYDVPYSPSVANDTPSSVRARVLCSFCDRGVLVADLWTHIAGYHGETKLAVVAAPPEKDAKLGER